MPIATANTMNGSSSNSSIFSEMSANKATALDCISAVLTSHSCTEQVRQMLERQVISMVSTFCNYFGLLTVYLFEALFHAISSIVCVDL
jgi:hypothetical protein